MTASISIEEFRWNLKRLLREGYPEGIPLHDLTSLYRHWLNETVEPNFFLSNANEWENVFQESVLLKLTFLISRKDNIPSVKIRPGNETAVEELAVVLKLASYKKFVLMNSANPAPLLCSNYTGLNFDSNVNSVLKTPTSKSLVSPSLNGQPSSISKPNLSIISKDSEETNSYDERDKILPALDVTSALKALLHLSSSKRLSTPSTTFQSNSISNPNANINKHEEDINSHDQPVKITFASIVNSVVESTVSKNVLTPSSTSQLNSISNLNENISKHEEDINSHGQPDIISPPSNVNSILNATMSKGLFTPTPSSTDQLNSISDPKASISKQEEINSLGQPAIISPGVTAVVNPSKIIRSRKANISIILKKIDEVDLKRQTHGSTSSGQNLDPEPVMPTLGTPLVSTDLVIILDTKPNSKEYKRKQSELKTIPIAQSRALVTEVGNVITLSSSPEMSTSLDEITSPKNYVQNDIKVPVSCTVKPNSRPRKNSVEVHENIAGPSNRKGIGSSSTPRLKVERKNRNTKRKLLNLEWNPRRSADSDSDYDPCPNKKSSLSSKLGSKRVINIQDFKEIVDSLRTVTKISKISKLIINTDMTNLSEWIVFPVSDCELATNIKSRRFYRRRDHDIKWFNGNSWLSLTDEFGSLQLPKRTIVYGEFVEKYKANYRIKMFHIIDCAVWNGRDIRQLSFQDRLAVCSEHLEENTSCMKIKITPVINMTDMENQIFDKIKAFEMNGGNQKGFNKSYYLTEAKTLTDYSIHGVIFMKILNNNGPSDFGFTMKTKLIWKFDSQLSFSKQNLLFAEDETSSEFGLWTFLEKINKTFEQVLLN